MRKSIVVIVFVLLAFASALFGAVFGAAYMYTRLEGGVRLDTAIEPAATEENMPQESAAQIMFSASDISTAITEAVERVEPAVVTVVGSVNGQLSGLGTLMDRQVSGSGFIISADGYIVTNNHVIEDVDNLAVILSDGTQLPADLVSSDAFADLAVLKAEGEMPGVAVLGDSDRLKPGETVIAIGSPLGDFRNSVTVGVVSATGRMLSTRSGYEMEDLIQTDAAINSGNSGGPLLNLLGEVVGVNTLVVRGNSGGGASAEGLGFAVPANTARLISEQIILRGYFARPYLGVQIQHINPEVARRYNLTVEWGAYVVRVGGGTPAERAGIQAGDIITRIGDKQLNENTQFINALFVYQPGERVEVEVVRGNEPVLLEAALVELTIP